MYYTGRHRFWSLGRLMGHSLLLWSGIRNRRALTYLRRKGSAIVEYGPELRPFDGSSLLAGDRR
jgi:hypothetical protein